MEIYGTIGPACRDCSTFRHMFQAGMTGIRLNLSHTSLTESAGILEEYQKAAEQCRVRPALLIDMQGPEFRIGDLRCDLHVHVNETIRIPMPKEVLKYLKKGDAVRIDDGKLQAETVDVFADSAGLRFLNSGTLSARKSIKIAGREVSGPVLTEADRENLKQAEKYGVTAVMEPFVTSGKTLKELRQTLDAFGLEHVRIFAKIENRTGVDHLSDILPEADMIVIARGDLGNDVPPVHLPGVQKDIAAVCLRAHRPFMVVTQMLTSMIRQPVPTRAEISDIYNAVLDGASALMATNETAVGDYPAAVIQYLRDTASDAEKWLQKHQK